MNAIEKNNRLISILLETIQVQEEYLTDLDKKEFPIVERTIHTILDIWEANKLKIKTLEVIQLNTKTIWIQVNDSNPVTFLAKGKEALCAT